MSKVNSEDNPKKTEKPISKQDVVELKKSLISIRKDLEKKRNQLKGRVKEMRKLSVSQEIPEWMQDVKMLYNQKDYTYWKLIRTLRKHKIL